jgi:hypothetical protein
VTDMENLCSALFNAWDDVIAKSDNTSRSQRALDGVFVMRSIEALMEHGFILPEVCVLTDNASDLHVLTPLHRPEKMKNGLHRIFPSSKSEQGKAMLIFNGS